MRAFRALEAWREDDDGRRGGAFLGRDRELCLLASLWDRVVEERRPHVVTVVGPPGIGKSRLAREFTALVEERGHRSVVGRSLPYGEGTGYGAFARQVKKYGRDLRDRLRRPPGTSCGGGPRRRRTGPEPAPAPPAGPGPGGGG